MHYLHFLRFLREDWGEFQSGMDVEGGRNHWKIRFSKWNFHRGKAIRTWPRWGSSWGLTQQHTYRLRKAHIQHFETHLSQNKTAVENSNNVYLRSTSHNRGSYSWRLSCYTQWGMHSGKTTESRQVYSVTKMWNPLGNEAMCKDTSYNKYNDQTN